MSKIYKLGIIGMGPAGLGFAMGLDEQGILLDDVVCFEQGKLMEIVNCNQVETNKCCNANACHVITGVGGASNLSSGKISDFPAGSKMIDFFMSESELKTKFNDIIGEFSKHIELNYLKIDEKLKNKVIAKCNGCDIEYKYYDVYTFNGRKYQKHLFDITNKLIEKGLTLHETTKVINVRYDESLDCFLVTGKTGVSDFQTKVKKIVISTGNLHLRDTVFDMLNIANSQSYEIGIRLEIDSNEFNELLDSHGDLKLKSNASRTYCVTKNGIVLSYKIDDLYFLEGSEIKSKETNFTNLAVMVKKENPIFLEEFINSYKQKFRGIPIKQSFIDYVNDELSETNISSSCTMSKLGNINNMFSKEINDEIKEFVNQAVVNILGVDSKKIIVIAPELKLINNLPLSKNFEIQDNIYVIGAATGKFRGILQSFCSGIKCSEQFNGRY